MPPLERTADDPDGLADIGLTDPLTGLGNERRFRLRVHRLIAEREADPAPFAIGIIDLDGFRPINDLFGRRAGDDILRQVAKRLHAAMDGASVVTRIGADEFAVLLPLVFSESAAAERSRMLIEVLSAPYDLGERTARLSASVGCALYFNAADTADMLVEKAETALYQAKHSGTGQVSVYTQEMEEAAKRQTRIEQSLRLAVAAGHVDPHFQPIVDLATREILGFEALARWHDAELGNVSPGLFIPIAEERGIIAPLSEVLLRKASEAARSWPKGIFLSFNLSPLQLVDQNTAAQIRSILSRTGFDPARLEIEITETGVVNDPVSAGKIIADLKAMGVRISLDDFGTGQSSLGRLRTMSFDKLKIDRSFVASMMEDRVSEHIIRAILSMCEGLDISVVAEGIETEAQARKLRELGCHAGQGYHFGRPEDAQATGALLRPVLPGA